MTTPRTTVLPELRLLDEITTLLGELRQNIGHLKLAELREAGTQQKLDKSEAEVARLRALIAKG